MRTDRQTNTRTDYKQYLASRCIIIARHETSEAREKASTKRMKTCSAPLSARQTYHHHTQYRLRQ